jgi:rubrerythrin
METRRELIAKVVGSALDGGDVGALRALARAEQVLVATYEGVLASGALSAEAARWATECLAHERAHLSALTAHLRRLGSRARRPVSVAGALPSTEKATIGLLLALERAAISVYYAELGKLRDPDAARTAAEIMACEAQHATALRELLSPGNYSRAVPSAFVFGNR